MPRRKRQPFNPAPVHDRRATEFNRGIGSHIAVMEIADPYEEGGVIVAVRSTRDDPLAWLHSRSFIDEAQYHGGRAFQADFEQAERGPRAIDPSKEAVDGGQMPEPITDGQQKAAKRLGQVYRELGADGSALAHDVLIHSKTYAQISASRGLDGERWEKYFGMRFQEVLNTLATVYGFAS